jgi:hypothetical protein
MLMIGVRLLQVSFNGGHSYTELFSEKDTKRLIQAIL